jgi:hypothetical protein
VRADLVPVLLQKLQLSLLESFLLKHAQPFLRRRIHKECCRQAERRIALFVLLENPDCRSQISGTIGEDVVLVSRAIIKGQHCAARESPCCKFSERAQPVIILSQVIEMCPESQRADRESLLFPSHVVVHEHWRGCTWGWELYGSISFFNVYLRKIYHQTLWRY